MGFICYCEDATRRIAAIAGLVHFGKIDIVKSIVSWPVIPATVAANPAEYLSLRAPVSAANVTGPVKAEVMLTVSPASTVDDFPPEDRLRSVMSASVQLPLLLHWGWSPGLLARADEGIE